jgi:excisionase family DNA binding protein
MNRRLPQKREPGPRDRLLDVGQASELLSVKPATLYQWAYQRRIPVVKLMGRALRFRESDLRKVIAEGVRPALTRNERPGLW